MIGLKVAFQVSAEAKLVAWIYVFAAVGLRIVWWLWPLLTTPAGRASNPDAGEPLARFLYYFEMPGSGIIKLALGGAPELYALFYPIALAVNYQLIVMIVDWWIRRRSGT